MLSYCDLYPSPMQNIRNNKTHARTPKWAQRYGLVDTSEIKRKERKSRWASRYNDRVPRSTLESQSLEEGQQSQGSVDNLSENGQPAGPANGGLWQSQEEQYYVRDGGDSRPGASSGRWHYPANFNDAVPEGRPSKKFGKKKEKKDRWARTEDAYSLSEETNTRKKSKKKKKVKSSTGDVSMESRDSSTEGFPEDPEGGLYGDRAVRSGEPQTNGTITKDEDVFNHQL
jgi:hypothetical protein